MKSRRIWRNAGLFGLCFIISLLSLSYTYNTQTQLVRQQQFALLNQAAGDSFSDIAELRRDMIQLAERLYTLQTLPERANHPLLQRLTARHHSLQGLYIWQQDQPLLTLIGDTSGPVLEHLVQHAQVSEGGQVAFHDPGHQALANLTLVSEPLLDQDFNPRILLALIDQGELWSDLERLGLLGSQLLVSPENQVIWRFPGGPTEHSEALSLAGFLPETLQRDLRYPEDILKGYSQELGDYYLARVEFGSSRWHLIQILDKQSVARQILPALAFVLLGDIVIFSLIALLLHSRSTSTRQSGELAYQNRLFLLSSLPQLLVDPVSGRLLRCNRAATRLFGFPRKTLLEIPFSSLLKPLSNAELEPRFGGEIRLARLAGNQMEALEIVASIPPEKAGRTQHYVILHSDKLAEDHRDIRYQAYYDPLTSLPNRNYLFEHLPPLLASHRRENQRLALLFVDLDRFKQVNDGLGHDVGDEVLRKVAERLKSRLRESDLLARLGGDEFTVVLPQLHDEMDASQVAQAIVTSMSTPMEVEGYDIRIGASVGIALFPQDGESAAKLIKHADVAMYQAKEHGRGGFCFFEAPMNRTLEKKSRLERDIHLALGNGQMLLEFQPIFRLRDKQLAGAESFLRWKHPELGILRAADFLQVAEETGKIATIGEWVLKESLTQVSQWADEGLIGSDFFLAINISHRQLMNPEHLLIWLDTLETSSFPSHQVILELDENCYGGEHDDLTRTLMRLKATGVRFSLDEFGKGDVSLRLFRQWPIQHLKVVSQRLDDTDPQERTFMQAMISLGRRLDLEVTASEIESHAQFEEARSSGCHYGQGYWFSAPLSVTKFHDRLVKGFQRSSTE